VSVAEYVLGLVVAVLLAAIGELVSDEIRARLDRVPLALLAMAARRLPPGQYKALYVEAWLPELRHVLQGDQATPITRLIHGIRFAASLWVSAPKIGRELADDVPYAEHFVRRTVRGELARSKSEVVIANYLDSIGLQYEYERALTGTATQGRVRPDFSFIDDDGNVVVWEHLGLLDIPGYAEHWDRRRAWYARNGFVLDKNLFVTGGIGGLDMSAVEVTAKKVKDALS
jgi:hypothetical protein